jgi:hypothetical protein
LDRKLNVALLMLTFVALFGMYASHQNSDQIVFEVSVAYLVSMIFWALVVYLPEKSRRDVLRDNLKRRYQAFKEDTIQTLLWASIGTHDSQLPKELSDHNRFREFFDANGKKHWYAALNGLQGNPDRIKNLLLEMELLANEVSYVLNNANITDAKVHSFFKRLCEHIWRLRNDTVYSYDQVKYLGGFLWSIHARWSIIEGQLERDVIDDMIHAL